MNFLKKICIISSEKRWFIKLNRVEIKMRQDVIFDWSVFIVLSTREACKLIIKDFRLQHYYINSINLDSDGKIFINMVQFPTLLSKFSRHMAQSNTYQVSVFLWALSGTNSINLLCEEIIEQVNTMIYRQRMFCSESRKVEKIVYLRGYWKMVFII